MRRFVDLLVARYKAARSIRVVPAARRDRRAAPTTCTSLFDRDSALDPSVAGALVRGEAPPEGWEPELRARLRGRPEVKEALDRMWPVLSGAELRERPVRLHARSCGRRRDDVLSDDEQALLHRAPRAATSPTCAWTEADVALVDEADALLGPVEAARPAPAPPARVATKRSTRATRVIDELGLHGYTDAATLAEPLRRAGRPNGAEPSREPRTFGHVLVDEAQDLTAMQWRMLARRCPSGSMTLVGDPGPGQPARARSPPGTDVLAHVPQHNPPRFVTLTVNYRTPAEVMEVAARLLAVAAPTVEPSRVGAQHRRAAAVRRRAAGVASSSETVDARRAARRAHRARSR